MHITLRLSMGKNQNIALFCIFAPSVEVLKYLLDLNCAASGRVLVSRQRGAPSHRCYTKAVRYKDSATAIVPGEAREDQAAKPGYPSCGRIKITRRYCPHTQAR